jgi:NodT family efflux transporter outer membrane factor (OMF) lipoprotein
MKTRMLTNGKPLGAVAGLSLLLAACAVGPDYHRPDAPMPGQFMELQGWKSAAPADAAPKGDWWKAFHDTLLDVLEPQVAVTNQTVRQAYYNYQEALANVETARAAYFPTIGATGQATRSHGVSGAPIATGATNNTTSNTANGATTGTTTSTTTGATAVLPSSGRTVNAGSVEATASWAPDIWGKVRRQVEEAKAVAQSDEATLANATLSEQTLLATTVIELRQADADIDLQTKTVAAYREALRVVQAQGDAGLTATPPSDVVSARAALESAEATLASLGVGRAQYAHAIAVLAGVNPENILIARGPAMPTLPAIPAGLPSALLQRRPDIAAAERTMAAQNAAVGVAIAAYYPNLTLSAADGFSQSPLASLFHAANNIWSIGANADETIFDFGARAGTVKAAKAAYQAAVAAYRQTVLTALQEVENDLSGLRILGEQEQRLNVAVKDAQEGVRLALAEYQAGTADYTTVAATEETLFADQQSRLTVQENRLLAAVSLIGDLGGGWGGK